MISEEEWAAREANRQVAARRAPLVDAGVPVDLVDLVFGGKLRMDEGPVKVAQTTNNRIVVLAGQVGLGKTCAAAVWLCREVPYGTRRLWVSAPRLARWERYDDEAMDRLLLASRLVIDELGVEFADTKGNFQAVLDEVVSTRFSNRRPTLITTNLNAEDFKARYGERIADRIREDGDFHGFTGKSLRQG